MGRLSFAVGPSFRFSGSFKSRMAQFLGWFMQRLPFLSHFCILLLAFIGPVMAPRMLAFVLLVTQTLVSGSQVRSAWGLLQCWFGVRAHSNTDWVLYWHDQKAKLVRDGIAHSVIPHDSIQHVILIPAYKEEMSTLKDTIGVLASHPLASTSYRICLGMEEREAGAVKKAETLVQFYRAQHVFLDICYSIHPGTIVGESAGKSSNINWAARWMAKRVPVSQHERCVVTVMDSDTCFAADYFLALAVKYSLLTIAKRRFTMFVPPILFDRNAPDVPVFTRLADIFWSCAGIGGIYPGSSVKIPTSAYSVSLELVKFCNFWDTGPESIGEDMHFYVKAMFETKGHVNSITIYSPASQCHVVGAPAHSAFANYVSDMAARWSQAVRHMWGSLDFGYCWKRVLLLQFGPSVRQPTYVALDNDHDGDFKAEREHAQELEDAEAVKSLFEAKLKAAEAAGVVRAVSPAGESVITESSVTSVDMFGVTRAKKFTSIDSPVTPHHLVSPIIIAPSAKLGIVQPPLGGDDDDDNMSDFGADEDRALFDSEFHSANVDDEIETPLYAAVGEKSIRVWPFIILMSRVYEAHLLIVHFFAIMGVLAFYPSAMFSDGSVQFGNPAGQSLALIHCLQAFFNSPNSVLPGAEPLQGSDPKATMVWVMPPVLLCAKQIAGIIGAIGVVSSIFMFVLHDLYHHACTTERWRQSENVRQIVLRERHRQGAVTSADNPADMPARYLGIRPSQTCERKWPIALLDFASFPAAIVYAAGPLLWAQLNHLATNKLTYTVSAKGKGLVVSTRLPAGESVQLHGRKWSVEHHRIASSKQELAVAVPHREREHMGIEYLPKPVTAI
ncbi:hypothetical protein K437DRAFT_180340 [Tilletiaria anomala UBC 951]|uniref:Glycosyltransferase 2-like domain-containing protein n=1 Tax=Tilletiaria anomala (strain ATCC 24038 / CBS 436.72 / UBC 951) TaxID=1037660 RepID=A0A066VQI7_TILAU|nr:uncharacterized protein K437DRAFT_180340 [Tilletiaria anomala UBC 951]KDN41059.1 hypothetical protein K437DRAFT_180340 [Tilletiaria anomala UBC 951]